MADSAAGTERLLRFGCFGCLGIVGVLLIAAAGVTGTAWIASRGAVIEERVLSPDLPEATGTVILDLSHAAFEIEPGPAGEPLRVEASYDTQSYVLDESSASAEGGSSYRLRFRDTGNRLLTAIREALFGTRPRVHILLPADLPMDLELDLKQGAAEVELGGLRLRSAEIKVSKGGLMLAISEPLRSPMERLSIDVEMGGVMVESLGNASPRRLDLASRMSGMDVDLRGRWLQDSEVSVHAGRGGGQLRLPRDVRIRGLQTGRIELRDPELPGPTLTFTASSEMGKMEISD